MIDIQDYEIQVKEISTGRTITGAEANSITKMIYINELLFVEGTILDKILVANAMKEINRKRNK